MLHQVCRRIRVIPILSFTAFFAGPATAQSLLVSFHAARVNPDSTLNLGNVKQGIPKDVLLTLRNVQSDASGPLSVNSVSVSGEAASDFEVLTALPITIGVNREATLKIRLTASATGSRRALFSLKHTGKPTPYAFELLASSSALLCEGREVAIDREISPSFSSRISISSRLGTTATGFRLQVDRTAKYFFTQCTDLAGFAANLRLCILDADGTLVA